MKRAFPFFIFPFWVGVKVLPALTVLSTSFLTFIFEFNLAESWLFLLFHIVPLAFLSVISIISKPSHARTRVPLEVEVCIILPKELDESIAPYYQRAGLDRNEFYFGLLMHAIEVGLPPSVDKALVTIIIPGETDDYFTQYCMSTGQDKADFYSNALMYALQVWFKQKEIARIWKKTDLKYIS